MSDTVAPNVEAFKQRAKEARAQVDAAAARVEQAERTAAQVEAAAGDKVLAGAALAEVGGQIAAAHAGVDAAKRAHQAAQRNAEIAAAERDLAEAEAWHAHEREHERLANAQGAEVQAFLQTLAERDGALYVAVRVLAVQPDPGRAAQVGIIEGKARNVLNRAGAHLN